MRSFRKILFLAVLVATILAFTSCEMIGGILADAGIEIPGLTDSSNGGNGDGEGNGNNEGNNGNGEGNNGEGEPNMSDYEGKVLLVYNKIARFNVVYTHEAGAAGKKAADEFVRDMRSYGVTIGDTVSDKNASDVTDCEIIIGTGCRNRGDACNIDQKYIGEEGQLVKIVGNRIIIAGGTANETANLLTRYIKNQMGITSKTKNITTLAVDASYNHLKRTEYVVESVKIDGVSIGEYTLIYDGDFTGKIRDFRTDLYNCSGIWIEIGEAANASSYDHCFIIRDSEYAGEDGFRAYIDGDDYIVECAYSNMFEKAYTAFTKDEIFGKMGKVNLPNGYSYVVNKVYYEDFGAKGDGQHDDFEAMYNAHIFANEGGQMVCGTPGKTYYIPNDSLPNTIPIKTDVDFGGASITVDDTTSNAFARRSKNLFTTARDYAVEQLTGEQVKALAGEDYKITVETESFPWLKGILKADSMVRVINKNHKDFIRHGANENSGSDRMDVFMVDIDGNFIRETDTDLDGNGVIGNVTTPVAYEFDEITEVLIYRADDKPITIKNGTFYNICCRTVGDTGYMVKYTAYNRGFELFRANVTIEGITHRMIDEPDMCDPTLDGVGQNHVHDSHCAKYGSRRESYPYYGFFLINYSTNLTIRDCSLTTHTVYYEEKPSTSSAEDPDPVAAGSYDFVVERSCNVSFINVTHSAPTGLADQRYWGIMSSNGSKNLYFEKCVLNRFDAHQSFWNATLIDTEIGHSFNVIGGGTLNAIRVKKHQGGNFIHLRSDYGSTFRGDVNIIDCEFENYPYYNTNQGTYKPTAPNSDGVIMEAYFGNGVNVGYRSPEDLRDAYNYAYELAIREGKTPEQATAAAEAASKQGGYWLWDFGYVCYMPINVYIESFKSKTTGQLYLYNSLPNEVFHYMAGDEAEAAGVLHINWVTNVYQITKSVTYANMEEGYILPCKSTGERYTDMNSIPAKYITTDDEE